MVYNGDWLSKLTLEDTLKLLSQFTVAQMVQREDFAKRLEAGKPVSLVEFMYPILQGYDSVAMEADIELGATEQKFNLLRTRDKYWKKWKNKRRDNCFKSFFSSI